MAVKKKTDRRPHRTRRQLGDALVELVKEKRFDDITVQNLIDRADVGRSTFYTHFRDKEDLFKKDWERFLDGFAEQINWDQAGAGPFVPILFLFRHLQDFQPFYKGLVRSRKADFVFKSGVAHLSARIEAALMARTLEKTAAAAATSKTKSITARASSVTIPILANYLASEVFSLLKWWLDHNMPYPPEIMAEIYHELVNPSLRNGLPDR